MKKLKTTMAALAAAAAILASTLSASAQYERFKHPDPFFTALYAFVEAPAEMLEIQVPPGAKWGTVVVTPAVLDAEGNEVTPAVTRQKTIGEFAFIHAYSLDGSTAVVMLAAIEAPTYRTHGVNAQDLAEWDARLAPYGLASGKWMNIPEVNALLATPAYAGPEEVE
jgi:hypothetical protein